jgi:hypothetical protein
MFIRCERCDAPSYGSRLCFACEVITERDRLMARVKVLEEALRGLVDRIDEVGEHPEYRAVWECAQLHRGPYRGPQYEREWKNARAALAAKEET